MTGPGFTRADWDRLATLFDGVCPNHPHDAYCTGEKRPYSGYKPETVEAPNGDTKVCDWCKGDGLDSTIKLTGHRIGRCQHCAGSGRVPNTDAAGVCGCCGGSGEEP